MVRRPTKLNIGSKSEKSESSNVKVVNPNGQKPNRARPMKLSLNQPENKQEEKTESPSTSPARVLNVKRPKTDTRPSQALSDSFKAHQYDVDPESEIAKQFTKTELNRAIGLASVLDISDHSQVLDFALEPQTAMVQVTDMALEETRRNNFVGTGASIISDIVEKGKSLDLSVISKKDTFFSKAFSFIPTRNEILEKFEKDFEMIADSMDAAAEELADLCDELIYKVEVLEELYKHNHQHFKELSVYIAAGEIKLAKIRDVDLPALKSQAEKSSDAFKVHEVQDLERAIGAFEQKLHDLKLTRMSTLQTAPQLRIVQANNRTLVDKIHSTIMTVIPLWKKQFIMAMAMIDQQDAMAAQKKITGAANNIMKDNADLLKKNSVELATEVASGDLTIEDLQYVQERLMETISETMEVKEDNEMKQKETQAALEQIDIDALEQAEKQAAKVYGTTTL